MKLYLVQHGEACNKEVDPDRPLTDQGREDIDRLATFLKQAGIRPDRVIHSGKLRAMQTAERLTDAIAPGLTLEANGGINPNDDPKAVELHKEGGGKEIMAVGHLPFMAKLVSQLLLGDSDKPIIAYKPGSVVCLERVDNLSWRVNWMIRPELLG
ncbi:MAG: phosphohistidine phosphatase SixA [Candidatus Thiodiazotropha endolucinida]